MNLSEYPRPLLDNGIGGHFSASCYSEAEHWAGEMQAMGWTWCKLLVADANQGLHNCRVLRDHGIMPVPRLYRAKALPDGYSDLDLSYFPAYVTEGFEYAQTLCEPNLAGEWADSTFPWDDLAGAARVTAHQWLRNARRLIAMGAIPLTPPLAPGGNLDDLAFFAAFLDEMLSQPDGLECLQLSAIAVHNYTLNHPITYTKDSNGFLKFRWYHQILRNKLAEHGYDQTLADHIPILSTEGGTVVGNHDDGTLPEVTVEMHRDWTVQQCEYMRTAEPWYFCTAFWLLANNRAGHWDAAWEGQAWYSDRWPGGHLPVVEALKALPRFARAQGGPVTGDERLRYFSDLWQRWGAGLNPQAAIAKEWLARVQAGQMIGPPVEPEHPTESGGYSYQMFSSGLVLAYNTRTGEVTAGLPPPLG